MPHDFEGPAGDTANGPTTTPRREAAVRHVARFHFHLTDLETRNLDALDFHSLPVWAIDAALRAAYDEGVAAGVDRERSARSTPANASQEPPGTL